MANATPEELNAKALEVSNALGLAMTQWGKIENELYLLYATLCSGGESPNPYSIIYETLVHLEVKINVISALIDFRITNAETLSTWTTIENKLRRKTKRVRNKLAHWRVWRDVEKGTVFLGPPLYTQSSKVPDFGTSHGGAMFSKDIEDHAVSFSELAQDVKNFKDRIAH